MNRSSFQPGRFAARCRGLNYKPVRTGFTLVELLVVIVIIAILITLVSGIVKKAFGTSKRTQTASQLSAISAAISGFKADFGYDPPLVTSVRTSGVDAGIRIPEIEGDTDKVRDAYRSARYYSEYSLSVFLMGMGNFSGESFGPNDTPNVAPLAEGTTEYSAQAKHDGVPGPGLRDPGQFKSWKTARVQGTNTLFIHSPVKSGRAYGPYIDPQSMKGLMEVVLVNPQTLKPAVGQTQPGVRMYRLLDGYGNPIRYYKGWRVKGDDNLATAAYVPVELREKDAVQREISIAGGAPSTIPAPDERAVLTASYMLLSPGTQSDDTFIDANGNKQFMGYGDLVPGTTGTPVTTMNIGPGSDVTFDPSPFGSGGITTQGQTLIRYLSTSIRQVSP